MAKQQSEAEYPPMQFEGIESKDSFNMFKSDQHELTGVHWGLHIENISKGNTYMKDNHNKWMTDGI